MLFNHAGSHHGWPHNRSTAEPARTATLALRSPHHRPLCRHLLFLMPVDRPLVTGLFQMSQSSHQEFTALPLQS
jgi:hypothetical protein